MPEYRIRSLACRRLSLACVTFLGPLCFAIAGDPWTQMPAANDGGPTLPEAA